MGGTHFYTSGRDSPNSSAKVDFILYRFRQFTRLKLRLFAPALIESLPLIYYKISKFFSYFLRRKILFMGFDLRNRCCGNSFTRISHLATL